MKRRLLILIAAVCAAAFAFDIDFVSDISGNWKATAEGPNGNMERTFTFKVDGNKVTGETTSSLLGKSAISDGKIESDTVTFTITAKLQDNEMKLTYKGKITDQEIVFESSAGGGGQTIEWHAKRQ